MGLLDDAIREHLELKRRRGADPAEVEQQEREALGPVRGGAAAVADASLDDEAPAPPVLEEPEPEPLAPDPHPEPVAYAEPEPQHHGAVRAPDPEPAYDPPPVRDPEPEPEAYDPPPPAREPEPEPAYEPPPPVTQPTQQYSVEDLEELRRDSGAEPEPDPDAEGEDVLDETPEFLQEAPEHDRLWFEQRPPRDFDF
jgi:hypothetical protein